MKGKETHSLDSKFRLMIPARFRSELGERFVMSLNLEHCINLYPQEKWNEFVNTLETLPKLSSPVATKLRRFFYSNSSDAELDGQGRILIPQEFRKYAGLEKEVKVVGVNDHLEIWDLSAWEANCETINPDELSLDLQGLNL